MKRLLRILFAIICLAVIVWYSDGLGECLALIAGADWLVMLLVLVGITLDRLLMTYKWVRLLRARKSHLPLLRATQIYCASMVWGLLLPATLGADAIRTICAKRAGASAHITLASIVIERALGFIATPLFALGSMLILLYLGALDPRLSAAWWFGIGLLLVAVTLLWASMSETLFGYLDTKVLTRLDRFKPIRLLRDFHGHYRSYRQVRGELLLFFLLTLLEQLVTVIIFWLVAQSMHVAVSPIFMAAAVPVAFLAARIPISAGGLGVFEGVFVLILSTAGVPAQESLSVALASRVLQIVAWLPWWLTYAAGSGDVMHPPSEPVGTSDRPT